jgi:hypothetical protein
LSLVSLCKVKSPAEPEIAPYVEESAPDAEEIAPSVWGAETTVTTGQAPGSRRPLESTLLVDGEENGYHAPATSITILVQRGARLFLH